MMGHKERLKSGDEYDAVTGWRRFLRWRPGQRSWVKTKLSRRSRSEGKKECIQSSRFLEDSPAGS